MPLRAPAAWPVPEQRRLADWFDAMNLRYGDRVAIDDPLSSGCDALLDRGGCLALRDLLVSDDAPATAGLCR